MTFLDALLSLAGARRRLPLSEAWRAFRDANPVEATAGDARERLRAHLDRLASDGRLQLPAQRGSAWDRSARPPLPEWVLLPRLDRRAPTLDPHAVPWAPELGFVTALSRVDHADELLAIQYFFASGGRRRPEVPLRERSVELFGDEKRLERLLPSPLFGEGRLTLAALRCFAMAPPLVAEDGPRPGRPALVVENHHTWWSFCRWNTRSGVYSTVVYGAGAGFGRDAVAFLAERCRAVSAPFAAYFGDLDPDGLAIPARAARSFAPAHGLRILPAARWYRLLLHRAESARLPTSEPLPDDAVEWLPADLHGPVRHHFRAGRRLPQELVGTEALANEGAEGG